jgi:hypothetical protein
MMRIRARCPGQKSSCRSRLIDAPVNQVHQEANRTERQREYERQQIDIDLQTDAGAPELDRCRTSWIKRAGCM